MITPISNTAAATCPDLPAPMNGMVGYNPDTPPRLEGTVATYSCDEGYQLSGGAERICQPTRIWGGDNIVCNRKC